MTKIKLFSIYTDEANELKDIFLRSIQDDWDLNISYFGQAGEGGGNTSTKGWYNILRKKIEFLVEKIKENQNKVIIWSDIDIQFFGRCSDMVENAIVGKDIVFQAEHWPQKEINTGFFVLRCNQKTLQLFESVLHCDIENLSLGDQSAINDILKENKLDISWGILPSQFWAMSHLNPPPPDIVLHHANCTFPVIRNGKTVGSIELKLEQYKMIRKYLSNCKTTRKTTEIMTNQAFLLLSDKCSPSVIKLYNSIKKASQKHGDAFILFHQKEQELPTEIQKFNHFAFTDDSLSTLNYISIENKFLPGSPHFPLLQFYLNNLGYSHYWLIEDDVRYNGDWEYFFETFFSFSHDFVSCHIHPFHEKPEWYWWQSLSHPSIKVTLDMRIRSFNPIYRISNVALDFIHNSLLDKWAGHHEVLIPTLLKLGNYDLLDFGGYSDYVLPDFKNKFYTDESMRFRPIYIEMGEEKNKLYHPIKENGYY